MREMTSGSAGGGARLGDLVRRAARARLVGRAREIDGLVRALVDEDARVAFVHGIGGIGKSSLLDALEPPLEERGARVLRFDGHEIAPTPEGLVAALAGTLGIAPEGVDAVAQALDAIPEALVVLAFDEYDALRLVDAWIRRTFLPAMPAKARVLFAGRSRPVAAWTTAPGWDALVRTLELGPLDAQDALALAVREGLGDELGARVVALAEGHPLALRLATAAALKRPGLPLAEIESRHVLAELVQRYLAGIDDPAERAAVEAASVLRRVNRPLLAAMLGDADASRAMDALAALPFVEAAADGLVVHQAVRNAVAAWLRAIDPARHRELRTRAWEKLALELDQTPRSASGGWQVTADVIYLVDDPNVRDAFFPSDTIRFGVEPASPGDRDAVLAIARAHAGPSEAAIVEAWWEHAPFAFFVARGEESRVAAFYTGLFATDVPPALLDADPLLATWVAHTKARFPRGGRPVLYVRTMLSAKEGAAPGEPRAACFLDLKRSYMANLDLQAIYAANYDGGEQALCDRFGFERIDEATLPDGPGGDVTTAMLNFGPGVLHWLGRLLGAQWEQRTVPALPRGMILCRLARALLIDGETVALTRLEFGLLDHLEKRAGAVCTRDELLASVWGQEHTGSNVVDSVVRSIRKKLGEHAAVLQTVTGHGYRLRAAT